MGWGGEAGRGAGRLAVGDAQGLRAGDMYPCLSELDFYPQSGVKNLSPPTGVVHGPLFCLGPSR
jgi:hypothetical protein